MFKVAFYVKQATTRRGKHLHMYVLVYDITTRMFPRKSSLVESVVINPHFGRQARLSDPILVVVCILPGYGAPFSVCRQSSLFALFFLPGSYVGIAIRISG